MPSSTPSPHNHPTPIPGAVPRRKLPFDRLVILLLGACGCVLSFDSLRQVGLAIHVSPDLSYLFPVVIDGFIAYGVRAILLLREAPRAARLYAWTLFGTATAASLWANSLHSVRLNSPGIHVLVLGNHTVAVLSTIAPMALGGATHLHILVTRHGQSHQPTAHTSQAAAGTAAAATGAGTTGDVTTSGTPGDAAAAETPSRKPAIEKGTPAAESAASQAEFRQLPPESPSAESPLREPANPAAASRNGRTDTSRPRARTGTGRPGRRADASIDQLAAVIARAHPESGQVTRAAARDAIQAAGLSAGNDRIAQALERLAQNRTPQHQQPTD